MDCKLLPAIVVRKPEPSEPILPGACPMYESINALSNAV